jgi:hypothetical protein
MTLYTVVLSFLSLVLGAGLFTAATQARDALPSTEHVVIRGVTIINTEDRFRAQAAGAGVPKSVASIVTQIQRADYEGDRAALKRLYEDLAAFAHDKAIGAKVRYWRGFAMWRRAFNGANASASDLEQDLALALGEFDKAVAQDPNFFDAKIAAASCLQNISALHYMAKDLVSARELMQKSFPLLKEAEAAQPDNPRLLWVLGAYRFYTPPERGGGQAFAIETYEKGLQSARRHKSPTNDALTPSWGEPELLMSLAFSNLNEKTPDLAAAESYAQQALVLVPYWHYVRDLLLPKIKDAKNKKGQ